MDPANLTVVKLREELRRRSLDTQGLKATLVERLQAALAQDEEGKLIKYLYLARSAC